MSNFDFPDTEEIPTIEYDPEDPFEFPETKNLFIKYDPAEWEYESDFVETAKTINHLFGSEVQVVVLNEKLEFMSREEVRDLFEDLDLGDDQ